MERATWASPITWHSENSQSVNVRASIHSFKGGTGTRISEGEIVEAKRDLKFQATTTIGAPFPSQSYQVRWQIVNTGEAARQAEGLRGDFYTSEGDGVRWEATLYRGVHWVQAFVFRRRDNTCVGKSARFFIVIE